MLYHFLFCISYPVHKINARFPVKETAEIFKVWFDIGLKFVTLVLTGSKMNMQKFYETCNVKFLQLWLHNHFPAFIEYLTNNNAPTISNLSFSVKTVE